MAAPGAENGVDSRMGFVKGDSKVFVFLNPDVAIPNPDKSTSKPLQLRIFEKLRVSEDTSFMGSLVFTWKRI